MVLSACTREVKFVSMLLEETTKVQKLSVIYEDNQGENFLSKNRQVGMSTKNINICHNFLRDIVEDKDVDIQYIPSEYNPTDIMTNNTLEADFVKDMKMIT